MWRDHAITHSVKETSQQTEGSCPKFENGGGRHKTGGDRNPLPTMIYNELMKARKVYKIALFYQLLSPEGFFRVNVSNLPFV